MVFAAILFRVFNFRRSSLHGQKWKCFSETEARLTQLRQGTVRSSCSMHFCHLKTFEICETWTMLSAAEQDLTHEASLTLPEVIEVREQDVCIVGRREPHHVVFGHLAQGFPIKRLEKHDIHLLQDVLLDGPVQPLAHVVLRPHLRIWNWREALSHLLHRLSLMFGIFLKSWTSFVRLFCFLCIRNFQTGNCRSYLLGNYHKLLWLIWSLISCENTSRSG